MLDAIDRRIVAATQAGLPLVRRALSGDRRETRPRRGRGHRPPEAVAGRWRDPAHRRDSQSLRARLHGQRHVGVGRRGRGGRRDRRAGSARSTRSPIATSGRATCRCGRTTCSPWCTARARDEVRDKVAAHCAIDRSCRALPRRPVFHPHPEEDRTAHRCVNARGSAAPCFASAITCTNCMRRPRSARARQPPGPVVIWNLIRRCNLTCKHCYSISGDVDFPGELSTPEVFRVMDDLKAFRVPVLILSGGEPLMRRDIFEISERAKAMKFYVGLSSNGTLVDAALADRIRDVGYDYVGISLDGIGDTHDRFRRKVGAYDEALNGLRLLRDRGIKVGVRFTMTEDNAAELPAHARPGGARGLSQILSVTSRLCRPRQQEPRRRCDVADDARCHGHGDRARLALGAKRQRDGNRDRQQRRRRGLSAALGRARHAATRWTHLRARLVQWGGNSSGVNVANIDNLGNVHPDTMWWHYTLGNVKVRPFSAIWTDLSDPIMAGLKQKPRVIGGRCGRCAYLRRLRRQHARARHAHHRRSLGRRSRLLSQRCRDRSRRSRSSASRSAPTAEHAMKRRSSF